MADDVHIREGTAQDAAALALLKWRWSGSDDEPQATELDEFAAELAAWMRAMHENLVCRVAESGNALVGMAWMVVYERVPNVRDRRRATGDIQSVFVVPERRGAGLGTALVRSLLAESDVRRIPRVTASTNAEAVALYRRAGFTTTPLLLERHHG